ncbi:hypothetical protein WOLCODRAFT_158849 [Wolfiporia cocos MD-104 SS10]|uniref:Uncharacterized protein n=1 Tax=Wolfiporia cocos (strain MD-104) TaxID=742152 RepID=A0A2H3JHH8_WOLCO|nr:hypothetical protein WOLCODRAFT_158849 [Wolfiporia cocos MD-104 SS10]
MLGLGGEMHAAFSDKFMRHGVDSSKGKPSCDELFALRGMASPVRMLVGSASPLDSMGCSVWYAMEGAWFASSNLLRCHMGTGGKLGWLAGEGPWRRQQQGVPGTRHQPAIERCGITSNSQKLAYQGIREIKMKFYGWTTNNMIWAIDNFFGE